MAEQILNIMKSGFNCAYSAFEVAVQSGMMGWILGIIFACIVSRFILLPVLGGRSLAIGSDTAKKHRNNKKDGVE